MVCTHYIRIRLNKKSVATVMLSKCRKERKYERQSCDTFPHPKKRGLLRVALRSLIKKVSHLPLLLPTQSVARFLAFCDTCDTATLATLALKEASMRVHPVHGEHGFCDTLCQHLKEEGPWSIPASRMLGPFTRNMSLSLVALPRLALMARSIMAPAPGVTEPTSSPSADGGPPSQRWQERAEAMVHQAQKILWSGRGRDALQYLRGRGFTDETIRGAHLGYIPLTGEGRWVRDTVESWGLSSAGDPDACLWLPEGILIPWWASGHLWKLTVRRLSGLKAGDAKYVQVKGSGEGLYNVDALGAGVALVVCESELDALSGQQTCADLAAFVATGATTRARRACWVERMTRAPWALIAYDDDLPGSNGTRAGDAGAAYWVRTLPQAIRWTPWAHDVNEMLQGGQDLRRWVELGRAVALVERSSVEEPSRSAPEGAVIEDARCEGWRDGDQPREEPSRKEAGARAPSASWPLLPTDELLPGDGPQEEPTRTQTRLQGITRVSTPLGPGRLFQETP